MAGPYKGRGHIWLTALTSNDLSQDDKDELMEVREEGGNSYARVQFKVASTIGSVNLWQDFANGKVSTDISTYFQNNFAGVALGTITIDYYGWLQIGGYHAAVKLAGGHAGSVPLGKILTVHATSDGKLTFQAIGTHIKCRVAGIGIASTGASTISALLTGRDVL